MLISIRNQVMKLKILERILQIFSYLQTRYQMISGTQCTEPIVYNHRNR